MGKGVLAGQLGAVLVVTWLTLSGKTDKLLLLGLGAASVLFVIMLVERLGILDAEGSPYHRAVKLLVYWGWLSGEIVKANLVVAREVLRADLQLTPRLFRIDARHETDFGRAVFANSITLTPGTVTLDVDGDELIIHALLDSMADPEGLEEMRAHSMKATEGTGW